MTDAIYIVAFAIAGAAVTIALAFLGDTEASAQRSEVIAYGVGGALFGGLMGALTSWTIQSRRGD